MDGWQGNPFTGFGNMTERWCCHVVQPSQYCIYWIPFAAVLEIFRCIVCSYKIVHFHTNYSSYHINILKNWVCLTHSGGPEYSIYVLQEWDCSKINIDVLKNWVCLIWRCGKCSKIEFVSLIWNMKPHWYSIVKIGIVGKLLDECLPCIARAPFGWQKGARD